MRLPLALFLIIGCAGPQPTPARWPASRYWVEEGFGLNPKEARQDAQARIAARVRSHITSKLAAVQGEINGEISTYVQRETVERVEFKYAELIQITSIDAHLDQLRATAVLDKEAALERLSADYERAAAPFRASIQAALRARDQPRVFTTHASQARARWPALRSEGWALASLGDRRMEADRRLWADLEAARFALLKTPIMISDFDDPLEGATRRALTDALKAEGLITSTRCEGLRLSPTAGVRCDESPLGPRCRLHLTADLRGCLEGEGREGQLGEDNLSAIHPKSTEVAMSLLRQKMSKKLLRHSLKELLKTTLPVEVP
ncbi:hypothetical protein KKF91_14620 [Myxococcota bacterium]|nr:hypothetical protein [Myxococcota bacterium]MBU1431774.1 hypothetical protein [Myxococcota bacterium]MBU1897469.1 hypothetical protein [Myxococcota bacterium]